MVLQTEFFAKRGKRSALLAAAGMLLLTGCGQVDADGKTLFSTVEKNHSAEDAAVDPEAETLETTETTVTTTTTETTTVTTTTTTAPPPWLENIQKSDDGVRLENVPHLTQFSSYLTGCETLATVSLLRYYGIDISPDEFIEKYLPITEFPHWEAEDNELHGESPWDYFLGDPKEPDAYGCYNTAIAAGVDKIAKDLAVPLRDLTLEEICETYIDNGEPVVLWATMYMAAPYDGNDWYLPDGEHFTFICPEHALVLVGYDDYCYYFSDSLQWQEVYGYSKTAVQIAYEALFSQALAIDTEKLQNVPKKMLIETEPAEDETDINASAE